MADTVSVTQVGPVRIVSTKWTLVRATAVSTEGRAVQRREVPCVSAHRIIRAQNAKSHRARILYARTVVAVTMERVPVIA